VGFPRFFPEVNGTMPVHYEVDAEFELGCHWVHCVYFRLKQTGKSCYDVFGNTHVFPFPKFAGFFLLIQSH
jgi:hypothetical protein